MTGTKLGQGTRGMTKIRNRDSFVVTDFFFAKQTKRVLIHENNEHLSDKRRFTE
jgi:hypothetical protein